VNTLADRQNLLDTEKRTFHHQIAKHSQAAATHRELAREWICLASQHHLAAVDGDGCRGRLRARHRTPGRELHPRDTYRRYVTSRHIRLSRARGQSRDEHDLRGNDHDSVTGARRAPSGHPAVSRKSTHEPSAPMSTMAPRRTSAEYSLPGFRQSVCPIFCAPRDSWMWPCSPTDGW
jgi:hypothetical protein